MKKKVNSLDVIFIGLGLISAIAIYNAVTGSSDTNSSDSGNSDSGSSGSGSGSVSTFNAQEWADSFINYVMPSCYIDCSFRYDILSQIYDNLSDVQIKDVSSILYQSYGKNMYELMSDLTWFGGPYTNNKATLLYNRIRNLF